MKITVLNNNPTNTRLDVDGVKIHITPEGITTSDTIPQLEAIKAYHADGVNPVASKHIEILTTLLSQPAPFQKNETFEEVTKKHADKVKAKIKKGKNESN